MLANVKIMRLVFCTCSFSLFLSLTSQAKEYSISNFNKLAAANSASPKTNTSPTSSNTAKNLQVKPVSAAVKSSSTTSENSTNKDSTSKVEKTEKTEKIEESMDPAFAQALNAGIALFNKSKYEESLADFQKALDMDKNNVPVRIWMSASYQKLNKHEDAAKILEEAVEFDPNNAELQNNLAFSYQQLIELEKAAEHYHKAVDVKKDFLAAHYNLAYVLKGLKKNDESIAEFKRVLELDPSYSDAIYEIGSMAQENKDYDTALKYYDEALKKNKELKKDKENAAIYCKLALIDKEKGDKSKAREGLEKVLDLDAGFYEALLNLGILDYEEKDFGTCINHLGKALEANPYDAAVHFWLGRYYYSLDQANNSIKQFADTLKLDPNFPEAQDWLDKAKKKKASF